MTQRWDLAYPKLPPLEVGAAVLAVAKKLRLPGRVLVATAPDRKVCVPASSNYSELVIALVPVRDPEAAPVLSITHRASGLALHEAMKRPHGFGGPYRIPATKAGVAAADAAIRALLDDASFAWSQDEPIPDLPPVGDPRRIEVVRERKILQRLTALCFPHLEALWDAQDRVDMRERREVLRRKHEGLRGLEAHVTRLIRSEFWWQAGRMWAATSMEAADRDRKLAWHG